MVQVEIPWDERLYKASVQKSPQNIPKFKYLYFLIILYLIIGTYSIISDNNLSTFFQLAGVNFGRAALLLLGIVVLPGILGRFRIEIKLTRIITLFRRQLGITVFLLAFTHYHFVRGLPRLTGDLPFNLPFPFFETMGFLALIIFFAMFSTSNNFSVKKLKKWWKRLHRFVYLAIWLLVLHTGLQRISIWTIFIGAFAILELASWAYFFFTQKIKTTLVNQSSNSNS